MNTNASQNTRRTLTEDRMANHKLALFVASAVSFAINLMLIVMLAIDGISFLYVMFPMLMCILSVAFIVISAFTNFRCSYSLWYTILYSLLFAITAVMFGLVLMGFGKESAMTYFAIGLWALVNLLNLIAIISGSVRAGSFKKGARATVAIIILLVSIVGYTYFITSLGFFGQGAETSDRPVTFVYDEEEKFYVATGTLTGKGKVVTVPDTFNGVKVGAIDCSIFSTENVHTVVLNCASNVEFRSPELLASIPEGLSVQASRDTLNGMTSTVYEMATTGNAEAALAFAQTFAPSDLSDNEVYVTFTYTEESVKAAEGKFMPIWIGEAGTALSFDDTFPSYVNGFADRFDESNLAAIFNTDAYNGGYVVSDIKDAKGNSVFGSKISENLDNVLVTFEKVYRVEVKADNDDLYELEDDFRFLDDANKYRFVTPSTAGDLLAEADPRDGFTLAWTYALGQSNEQTALTDLAAVVATEAEENLSIKPTWTMLPPTITSCTTNGVANTFTYGDDVTFSAAATAPAAGLSVRYKWFKDGVPVDGATSDSFDINRENKVLMTEAGEYTVVVTSYSDTLTSLESTSEQKLTLTVNKKELPITWLGLDSTDSYGRVYNAQNSRVNITYDSDALVYGEDTITWQINDLDEHYIRNAGSHTATAKLTGDADTKYYIKDSAKSNTYTISPAEITLVFSNHTSQTYNGTTLYPTVVHSPLQGSDTAEGLGLQVGGKLHVSDSNTVYASITDTNYKIVVDGDNTYSVTSSGAAQFNNFEIKPASLKLDFSDNSKVYTAAAQRPTVSFVGLFGEDDPRVEIGTKTNVAEKGNIEVYISNTDYVLVINPEETYTLSEGKAYYPDFRITPAPLTLAFTNTSLVYNSTIQYPTVTPLNLLGNDNYDSLGLTIGGKTNVTDNGNIEVSLYDTIDDPSNYALTIDAAETYNVVGGKAVFSNFTITKAPITVIWNELLDFEYSGSTTYPTVDRFDGVFEADLTAVNVFTDVELSGQIFVNSEAYTAYAKMTGDNGNYELVNNVAVNFTIHQKPLTVNWTNTSLSYTGVSQRPTATLVSSEICGSDHVEVEFSLYGSGVDAVLAQNAATYTAKATLSGEQSANYIIKEANVNQAFTITPALLTLTFDNIAPVYNGKAQRPTVIFNGLQNGELAENVLNYTVGAKTNVSENKNSISIQINCTNYKLSTDVDHSDYTVNTTAGTATYAGFTITPKNVTLTFGDRVYNGTAQIPVIAASGLIDGQSQDILGITSTKKTNVTDTSAITVTISNTNYRIEAIEGSYTVNSSGAASYANFRITPKELKLTWSPSKQYNGLNQQPTVTATTDTLVAGDNPGISIEGTMKNVTDSATFKASISNPNYVLVADAQNTYSIEDTKAVYNDFAVTAAPIRFTFSNTSLVYNSKAQSPTVTPTGMKNSEKADVLGLTVGSKTLVTDQSDIEISISNSNYYIEAVSGRYTVNLSGDAVYSGFTIKPASIYLSFANTNPTYNGLAQKPDVEPSGIQENDTVDALNLYVTTKTNVADPAITVSIDNPNYKLATNGTHNNYSVDNATGIVTFNGFVVKPAEIQLSFSNTIQTYNKTALRPDVTFEGLQNNEDPSVLKYTIGSKINVIDPAITITIDNGNYKLVTNSEESYTVNSNSKVTFENFVVQPAPLTVTFYNTVDENAAIYNNKEQFPDYEIAGLVDGDNESILKLTKVGKTLVADTAAITLAISNSNYILDETTNANLNAEKTVASFTDFTIQPKEIYFNFSTQVYNGKAQQPGITVKGLLPGHTKDVLNMTVNGTQTVVDQNSEITVSISNSNYKIVANPNGGYSLNYPAEHTDIVAYYNETFITKAPITLTFSNLNPTYNGSEQYPGVTTIGRVNGEAQSELNLILGGKRNVGDNSDITLTINNNNYKLVTDGSHKNYTVVDESTATFSGFSIKAKTVTPSWQVLSGSGLVYSASSKNPVVTSVDGFVANDNVDYKVEISGNTTDGHAINVGNYTFTIVLTGDDASNYSILSGYAKQSITITKKSVTVTWTSTTFTYDGEAHAPTPKVENNAVFEADMNAGRIYFSDVSGAKTNVGDYSASVKIEGEAVGNYNISASYTTTFRITSRPVEVTWTGGNVFDYNGNPQGPAASVDDPIFRNQGLSITYTTPGTYVGDYEAEASMSGGTYDTYRNFHLTNYKQSYKIKQATIVASWTLPSSLKYDGNQKVYTASYNGNSITVIYYVKSGNSWMRINYAPISVGEYKVVASDPNYIITNAETTFIITSN